MTPLSTQDPPISYGSVKFGNERSEPIERNLVEVPGEAQLWLLQYRHKGIFKYRIFAFEGSRQEAIERAKQHCSVQGFKMEWLESFLTDLDYEDQKTLRGL